MKVINPDHYESSMEGQFLVAMPQLDDPYFARSVTYIWRHDQEGALGLVVNKPLAFTLTELFEELDISIAEDSGLPLDRKVLAGGPVEQDKGFILHKSQREWDSSIKLRDKLSICTSPTILKDIAQGKGPSTFTVILGCAGWDAGQLEDEIIANAWLTVPADHDLIFSDNHEHKPEAAAALLGINLQQLPAEAGHS